MPDAAALASVVVSGTVAIGSLLVTYRSARDQRKHEAQLAYEARAWEKKSESLFSAIATARSLVDTVRSPDPDRRNRIVLGIEDARDRLDETVPSIEAYASAECRRALHDLRELLLALRLDPLLETRVVQARLAKEAAIDARDFQAAVAARIQERDALRDAVEGLDIDSDELATRANRLIDAARASVRGKD